MTILIIGAGAAGLAAAHDLCAAGHEVTILEARHRIGGRIHTSRDPRLPLPAELGAEFVHGRSPEIFDIVWRTALPACAVADEHWCVEEGPPKPCEGHSLDRVFEKMREAAGPDRTFAEFLTEIEPELRPWAASYVEGFNAARKERISLQSLVKDQAAADAIDGDRSFRILPGYDRVPQALLPEAADLHLNTTVREMSWSRGLVEAITARGALRGSRAVITLPLGVLQANDVKFDPEPVDMLHAAHRLATGDAARVTFLFDRPFWPEMGFLHSFDPAFPTWWTTLPVHTAMITCWAAGPRFDRYVGKDGEFVAHEALAAMSRLFRQDRVPQAFFYHDWHADPFARGAYSYVPVGALDAREKMAAPVDDTLYFAGEATETEGHSATVHGAIASGRRAARQILRQD